MKKIQIYGLILVIIILVVFYVSQNNNNIMSIKTDSSGEKKISVTHKFIYKAGKETSFFSRLKYPLTSFGKVKLLLEISNPENSIEKKKYIFNESNSTGVFSVPSEHSLPNAYNLEGYIVVTKKEGKKISGTYRIRYSKIEALSKNDPEKIHISGEFNDIVVD